MPRLGQPRPTRNGSRGQTVWQRDKPASGTGKVLASVSRVGDARYTSAGENNMRHRQGLLAIALVVVIVAAGCDIVRVSVSNSGAQANGQSQNVSLSADASLVAFDS